MDKMPEILYIVLFYIHETGGCPYSMFKEARDKYPEYFHGDTDYEKFINSYPESVHIEYEEELEKAMDAFDEKNKPIDGEPDPIKDIMRFIEMDKEEAKLKSEIYKKYYGKNNKKN